MTENNNNIFGQNNNEMEMPQMNTTNNMPSEVTNPVLPAQNNNSGTISDPLVQNVGQNSQPVDQVEIPQSYYNQLEQEKREAEAAAIQKEQDAQEIKNNQAASSKLLMLIIISAIVIFGSLYATVNINEKILALIPIYIIIGSIVLAISQKKNSDFPNGMLMGGMLVAIITFVMSMTNEEEQDLWTYYAIAAGVSAIIGLITSNILTKIVGDTKNVKGVHILGSLLYITALVVIPMYLYNKYPEEFYRYVFYNRTEIKAETEDEFIVKTLKNRYGMEFTCGSPKHYLDENKIKVTTRTCKDPNGTDISVKSTAYNESTILYIVEENYLETLYLKEVKEKIQTELKAITGGTAIVYMYPETGCSFVGDCYDSEAYNKIYKDEINRDNKYKKSSTYNFEKYMNISAIEFANEYKFKYFIEVSGLYSGMMSSSYDSIVESILTNLNSSGIKNTSGYEIIIKNTIDDLKLPIYKVVGEASTSGFTNPKIVDIN